MIIKSMRVKNFRAILDEAIDCDNLTVLVGRNGAGKSSFLRALEMFYEPSATATMDDFYAEDTSKDIEITVTFSNLDSNEKTLFGPYLDGESLTIARVFSLATGKKSGAYHGSRLQNSEFIPVRSAGGKKDINSKYKEIREQAKYSGLLAVKTADDAESAMKAWEIANPALCSRQHDDGQ